MALHHEAAGAPLTKPCLLSLLPTACAPKPRGHCHTPDLTAAPAGEFSPFPVWEDKPGPRQGSQDSNPLVWGALEDGQGQGGPHFQGARPRPCWASPLNSSLPRTPSSTHRRGGPPPASQGLLSGEALGLQGRALSDLTPEASPASCYHHSCRGFCLGGRAGALRVCPPPPPSPSTGPAPSQGSESGHCSQQVAV